MGRLSSYTDTGRRPVKVSRAASRCRRFYGYPPSKVWTRSTLCPGQYFNMRERATVKFVMLIFQCERVRHHNQHQHIERYSKKLRVLRDGTVGLARTAASSWQLSLTSRSPRRCTVALSFSSKDGALFSRRQRLEPLC